MLKRVTALFKQSDSNRSMIWRELYADVFQNILKYSAFTASGSQAMKAENMRAFFDCINHLVMLGANKSSEKLPDQDYNYGYGRIKNLAVIVPGVCFFSSGLYNVYSPLHSVFFLHADIAESLTINLSSLSLIIGSSFVEFWLFYKNVGDVKEFPRGMSFITNVKERVKLSQQIITQKIEIDSIQSAIVTENVLAILGVCTPIVTSGMYYLTNIWWLDAAGQGVNGIIQMYLGYLILQDNFKILIGRSLPAKYTNQIREYIESRDEILKVFKIKSKNLDSQCYSIAVDLSYDPKYISSLILEELKSDIAKTPPSASEEVKRLISKSIEMVLLKEVELNEKLKKEIRDKFPDVVEVDIESKSK